MERSEEAKILQAPITVTLGGKEHSVKPLVIRDSREWRKRVVKVLAELPQYAKVTSDNPEAFEEALSTLLVAMPEKVIDLFFGYARDLDRDAIEQVATDSELAKAFDQVVEIAFPLSRSLVGTMQRLAQ